MRREPAIFHCTSEPARFFGRQAELALLDRALAGGPLSVAALVGPGGQGKTAIVRHWLEQVKAAELDGLFFWSFYRGKDSDLCLRELYGYAEGLGKAAEVSASFAVDRLLPILRRERWAMVLDGAEVVQHETGAWQGRFIHPELGRLLEELASAPLPGVLVLTTRFAVPMLERRPHAQIISLTALDLASGRDLLASLGVRGSGEQLEEAALASGLHAKAVELLGTYVVRFHAGQANRHRELPGITEAEGSAEEVHVLRVLNAFQQALAQETKDILTLATAFRQPPTEACLLDYLSSKPVEHLLHETWKRSYQPFAARTQTWLAERVQELIDLRLLERVGLSLDKNQGTMVIDAHPLVRRGFEMTRGGVEQAKARAGFLRGRPDRRAPATLEEAREEVELFHAFCDAGLWNEADSAFVALDNPKHRFLAPAFERDLLLGFFPNRDFHQAPLWPGFGRYRSLAISLEMLGQYEDALAVYRGDDWPLAGDALIALGRLEQFFERPLALAPWQTLWQAYRAHALSLVGRRDEALALAKSLVPVDIYEWVHVFECLLRLGELKAIDLESLLYRPPFAAEHRWSELARRRMKADYLRLTDPERAGDLDREYAALVDEYDKGGLAWERVLTRLSWARWLQAAKLPDRATVTFASALDLARRHGLRILERDAQNAREGRP
jgi:hypothetical protein